MPDIDQLRVAADRDFANQYFMLLTPFGFVIRNLCLTVPQWLGACYAGRRGLYLAAALQTATLIFLFIYASTGNYTDIEEDLTQVEFGLFLRQLGVVVLLAIGARIWLAYRAKP